MKVSVVIPAKNEEATIGRLLENIFAQSRKPDEVVITDGGSTDATKTIVKKYIQNGFPVKLIEEQNAWPGRGRNLAIQAASHELIAPIDCGCVPSPDWLEELVGSLENDPSAGVVFGRCVARGEGVLQNLFILVTVPDDWVSVVSMVMKKSVWQALRGFNENLRCAEDVLFIRRIKKAGFRTLRNERAVTMWRPRETLGAFMAQFYGYAKGHALINENYLFYARKYLFYLWELFLIGAGIAHGTKYLVVALLYFVLWVLFTIREHYECYASCKESVMCFPLLPLVLVCRDAACMGGFLSGIAAKFAHHERFQ